MRRSLTTLLVLLALATCAASLSAAAEAASAGTSGRATPASKSSSVQARSVLRARLARRVTSYARRQLGTPYRWGGASPGGFDCSGLIYAAYRAVGRSIPRTTWGQLQAGTRVSWQGLRPGDLLFTNAGGHVAIVVSRTVAISAPRTGYRVRFVPLSALRGSFYAARRML